MGVETISVTDTAYNLLLSMKSEDEDISEAIIRLLKKKSRLVECAGLWRDIPDEELEEIEEGMREMRESLNSLDGMVAAISLTHGCNVIVTRNVKHFERIEGIEVEEY